MDVRNLSIYLASLLFIPFLAQAEEAPYFELQGLVGYTNLSVGKSHITFTNENEITDTLRKADDDAFQGGVGLMYVFPLRCNDCNALQWFPTAKLGLRAYGFSHSVQGDEWQFEEPEFDNFTYKYDIDNFRLMFDGALTIASWKNVSAFVLGGIGPSWNWVKFKNISNEGTIPPGDPSAVTTISRHQHTTFAWEVGAGVQYYFTDHLGLSLEYLFTDYGRLKTGTTAYNNYFGEQDVNAAKFRLDSNTLFLGLELAI